MEIDLSRIVFEQMERATYEQGRRKAKHITRNHLAHINWVLQVQPMMNGECYLYRDHLIMSSGGWWTCIIPDSGPKVERFADGTLEGIMDLIDKAINRHIVREAVKAVITKHEHPTCPGCKNEIDPEVCHCGDEISKHNPMWCGHNPVPMGCTCGYAK
jgi:hypothetical protein